MDYLGDTATVTLRSDETYRNWRTLWRKRPIRIITFTGTLRTITQTTDLHGRSLTFECSDRNGDIGKGVLPPWAR